MLVPEERLELSWCRHRRILSPLRLPVPPFRPRERLEIIIPPVLVSSFDYELPAELIAQHPVPQRSASRLLHLDAKTGALQDLRFRDLPRLVGPEDVLVLNDTRVVKARLLGRKPSGGRVELFVERITGDDPSALIGLPLMQLITMLRKQGVTVTEAAARSDRPDLPFKANPLDDLRSGRRK